MQVTITIHPSWLMRHRALGAALAGFHTLERPAPEDPDQPGQSDRGDAWEPPGRDDDPGQLGAGIDDAADEDAPRDGRQLLGWCAKQLPDMKGAVMSFGKKRGLNTKIVAWSQDQVLAAYRYARNAQGQGGRS
jgi:hypothetical protein